MTSPSPHLVVDARTVRETATGIGQAVAGWLQGLDEIIGNGAPIRVTAIRLVENEKGRWDSFWNSLKHVGIVETNRDYEKHPLNDVWLHRHVPKIMKRLSGDVLFSPAFISPFGRQDFVRLLMVPDVFVWSRPDNYPKSFAIYLRTFSKRSMRSADAVLTLSPASAAELTQRELSPHRPRVLPCAVDHTIFRPREDAPNGSRPRIVYVASFEERKNHAVLFEALKQPSLRHAELTLVHRATPTEIKEMRGRAEGLSVRFVLPNGPEEIHRETSDANIVVFPSLEEGFGIPVLEAMATGVPLVASDIPAIQWLTRDGDCARLVDPTNPTAWAIAITEALSQENETNALVQQGLERANEFTWRRAAETLLSLVQEYTAT